MDPKIVVCCEDRSAIQDDRSATDDEVSYVPKKYCFLSSESGMDNPKT